MDFNFANHSTFKEDLCSTPAELVYGTTLRIPGEFFNELPINTTETQTVVDLRKAMRTLRPTSTSWHGEPKIFVQRDLNTSSHVFIRDDSIRPSLSHPYDGPYEVIERNSKYFKVIIGKRQVNISIDRMKPAYLPELEPQQQLSTQPSTQLTEVPSRITRSGRHVQFPDRLSY